MIGDVHCALKEYKELLKEFDGDNVYQTIQVGDMGLFRERHYYKLGELHSKHGFIRGNHDNPVWCRSHANYLGDYGYQKNLNLFYMSGAFSVDKHSRTQGRDWWPDEELSMGQLNLAIALYKKTCPDIVITHTLPAEAKSGLVLDPVWDEMWGDSKTSLALQSMLEFHRPKLWVFGHFHQKVVWDQKGTTFVCVASVDKDVGTNRYTVIPLDFVG